MEPLTALSTTLAAVKTLQDLLKRNGPSAEVQRALADLLGALIQAQQREAEMLDEIRRLRSELSALQDWGKVMGDYRLESVGRGVLAYVHQPSKGDLSTAHWLCQCCADAGRKVVLQCVSRAVTSTFKCPQCGFTLTAGDEASKTLGAESYPVQPVPPARLRRRGPLV